MVNKAYVKVNVYNYFKVKYEHFHIIIVDYASGQSVWAATAPWRWSDPAKSRLLGAFSYQISFLEPFLLVDTGLSALCMNTITTRKLFLAQCQFNSKTKNLESDNLYTELLSQQN